MRTGNVEEHTLENALVELTAPDGRVFRFRYGATVPYAGQDYVVLVELSDRQDGQEQILVTRLEERHGELTFAVAEEEDVVSAVFEKYLTRSLRRRIETEEADCACGCGHSHGKNCGCDAAR